MRSPLLGAALLALIAASASGEPTYKMPVYPEKDPPAPRTQAEVDALLAGSEVVASPKPLKVLLVAGPKDHKTGEHDYPAWQKVWRPLLESSPQTTVDEAWEFPTEEQAAWADVMVFYQRGRWNDDRALVIDPFLARGGGLVYVHWAVDGRGGEAEFAKRIGLASKGGSISYRHGLLHMDFSPGADHPIARNLDKVDFVDEAYWRLTGDPSKLNLIGTSEEEGEPRPLFWTVERGRGRVFVSIPGHYMWTFDDPVFRALLLRGIAWSGRASVDRFNDLVTLDARVE